MTVFCGKGRRGGRGRLRKSRGLLYLFNPARGQGAPARPASYGCDPPLESRRDDRIDLDTRAVFGKGRLDLTRQAAELIAITGAMISFGKVALRWAAKHHLDRGAAPQEQGAARAGLQGGGPDVARGRCGT